MTDRDARPPCPPDEHCPSCTRDEEDECCRCGMSREDRYTQFNAWLDEVDDDEATVVDAADASPGWTRRTWPCDQCRTAVNAYTQGDGAEGVRLIHDEGGGHRLVMPPSPEPYWLDKLPGGVDVDLRSHSQRDRMPRILTEGADWTGAPILGCSSGPGAAP